jgi:hypothetical protein
VESSSQTDKKQNQDLALNSKGGVIAGAGGGTLIVTLANLIPDSYKGIKDLLILSAPSIAVGIGYIYNIANKRIKDYFIEIEKQKILKETNKILQEMLNNPNLSKDSKEKVRKAIDEFNDIRLQSMKQKLVGVFKIPPTNPELLEVNSQTDEERSSEKRT